MLKCIDLSSETLLYISIILPYFHIHQIQKHKCIKSNESLDLFLLGKFEHLIDLIRYPLSNRSWDFICMIFSIINSYLCTAQSLLHCPKERGTYLCTSQMDRTNKHSLKCVSQLFKEMLQ